MLVLTLPLETNSARFYLPLEINHASYYLSLKS